MAITCPQCGATSHNPNDEREGYCGRCHAYTSQPPGTLTHIIPPGLAVDVHPDWCKCQRVCGGDQ